MLLAMLGLLAAILMHNCGCAVTAQAQSRMPPRRGPVPPIHIQMPPMPYVPNVEVNVYEDGAVDVNGPAQIKRHSSPAGTGLEVTPLEPFQQGDRDVPERMPPQVEPFQNRPYEIDTRPAPQQRRADPLPTEPAAPPAGGIDRAMLIRAGIVIGSMLLATAILALMFKFRGPMAQTVKKADLQDGVMDEVREFIRLSKAQLQREADERVQAMAAPAQAETETDIPAPEETPPAKNRATK